MSESPLNMALAADVRKYHQMIESKPSDTGAWLGYHHAFFKVHGTAPDLKGMSLQTFLALLEEIPWLEHLGEPSERDFEVDRIWEWKDYPSPYLASMEAWHSQYGEMHYEIEDIAGERLEEIKALQRRIQEIVMGAAVPNIPLYQAGRDPSYAPTTCIWGAVAGASLVGGCLFVNEVLPPMLRLVWGWYVEGHWPCGSLSMPEGGNPGRLLVY